jgi:hypothetical protein
MRYEGIALCGILACAGFAVGPAHGEEPGAIVVIRSENPVVRSADEAVLDVALINISNLTIDLISAPHIDFGEYDYSVEMVGPNNLPVQPTEYGRDPHSHMRYRTLALMPPYLVPGAEIRQKIRLGTLFDMETPGIYTIQVTRIESYPEEIDRVSNKVSLTFAPKAPRIAAPAESYVVPRESSAWGFGITLQADASYDAASPGFGAWVVVRNYAGGDLTLWKPDREWHKDFDYPASIGSANIGNVYRQSDSLSDYGRAIDAERDIFATEYYLQNVSGRGN